VIKLLVCTNDPLATMGLKVLFQSCADISLECIAARPPQLLPQISARRPDVVLLEADEGINTELYTHLRRQLPDTNIAVWVYEITPEQAYLAIECGVRGILRKRVSPGAIVECISQVARGELWIEKTLSEAFASGQTVRISNRERELIALITQGLKNKEIAQLMWITEGTVKVYLSRLYTKVGVKDRLELALFGLRNTQNSGELSSGPFGTKLLLVGMNGRTPPREQPNGIPKQAPRFDRIPAGSHKFDRTDLNEQAV